MNNGESWQVMASRLRERDHDPAYANAPVLDAYARISKSPDGDLEKTDRQLTDVLAAILGRRARLGEVLSDANLSAWKLTGKRPGWRRLVERLRTGASAGVLAWHTDRMMRQPRDLEELIDLANAGATVGTCFGEYRLDDADSRFQLRILTAAACKASDDTSRRQKRKHEAMRLSGKVNGGRRSFGWQGVAPRVDGDRDWRVPESQVTAERAAILWGSQAVADGATLAAVAREWTARGLVSADGKAFTPTGVRGVLLRASNAALIEHDGVVVGRVRDVEPIVDEQLFGAVRAVFAARKRGRPVGERHVLAGVMRCGLCEAKMAGGTRSDKTYPDGQQRRRYRCGNPLCAAVSIDARAAEEWARELTATMLADPQRANQVARRSAELAKVDTAITSAEETGRALAAKLGAGTMPLDRYEAAVGPLDERLIALYAQRDALVAAGAGQVAQPADVATLLAKWDAGDVDERRRLVGGALPHGIACAKGTPGGWSSADERLARIDAPRASGRPRRTAADQG
jgi:DNA invertase Pin-like site-specific DNA recombinase